MKWTLIVLFSLIGLGSPPVHALFVNIRPFQSDGCSKFPEGTLDHSEAWDHCCYDHDIAYWIGGTSEERQIADEDLRTCVADSGYPDIAELMYLGVRAGGTGRIKTSFRWGYGWEDRRDYGPLNEIETDSVQKQIFFLCERRTTRTTEKYCKRCNGKLQGAAKRCP